MKVGSSANCTTKTCAPDRITSIFTMLKNKQIESYACAVSYTVTYVILNIPEGQNIYSKDSLPQLYLNNVDNLLLNLESCSPRRVSSYSKQGKIIRNL